jgi:hypothetical protein
MPTAIEIVPGNTASCGADPIPDKRATVLALPVALSVITSAALRIPDALGEKATATLQIESQATGPVMLKSDGPRTLAEAEPTIVGIAKATSAGADVLPTATVPNVCRVVAAFAAHTNSTSNVITRHGQLQPSIVDVLKAAICIKSKM